jgi:type I restriction enzyme S subunit
MIKNIFVSKSQVEKERRFNPKYFYFIDRRDRLINSSTYKFAFFSDKKYFPIVSDGIHGTVSLMKQGKIKYLYVHSLKEGFIDITDNLFLEGTDHKKYSSKELKFNDVLLSVVGTLGSTAIFRDYVEFITSIPRNIAYIRVNEKKILPEYLMCFLLSKFSKEQCIFSGGGNIQGLISLTKLNKFVIPIPSLKVQEKYRDALNDAIHLQKIFLETISNAKRFFYNKLQIDFQAIKKDMNFNPSLGDLIKNELWTPNLYYPYPDKLLGEIGKKFELVEIGTVATIKKGNEIGSDVYQDYLSKNEDSVPFIRTSDIFNHEIDSFPDFYAPKSVYNDLNQDFKVGDLIINNDGRIGYPAMITKEDKAIFQSHIKRIRVKNENEFDNNYIFLCLLIPEIGGIQFKKFTVVQSTIPTIAKRIEQVKIPKLKKEDCEEISNKIKIGYKYFEEKKMIIKHLKKEMNLLLDYN